MPEFIGNYVTTTLTASIVAGDTSISVDNAVANWTNFPAAPSFRLLIGGTEYVLVTAGGNGSSTWTVVRGQEGSTAASHASGASVALVVTANQLRAFVAQQVATDQVATIVADAGIETTSYSNIGGKGDRQSIIFVSMSRVLGLNWSGDPNGLVDGSFSNSQNLNNSTTTCVDEYFLFDFGFPRVVTELIRTGSTGGWTPSATLKVQGSNDAANWTDLSTAAQWALVETRALTTKEPYRWYRIIGTAGTWEHIWWEEVEFKISTFNDRAYTAWDLPGSIGDRSAMITVSKSAGLSVTGSPSYLVGGAYGGSFYFNGSSSCVGQWLQFDFGTPYVITGYVWQHNYQGTPNGTWKIQGSNDASTWTDLTAGVPFDAAAVPVSWANTTPYRYYRLLGTTGNWVQIYNYGIDFKIGRANHRGAALGVAGSIGAQSFEVRGLPAVHPPFRVEFGTAAPTTGTWAVGDTVVNTAPAAAGYCGWRCVTAGTPGTWKGYGTLQT